MDRLKHLSKSSLAAAAAAVMAFAAACDSPVEITAFEPPLDTMACQDDDLPAGFSWQTDGTFTLDDLAGVAADPGQRREELRDAGIRAGYFSNWRQTVSRPPFDPPIDVTCQVVAFEDAAQAERFVDQLAPGDGAVASTAVTWLPEGERGVTEIRAAGLPPGSRLFRIAATDAGISVGVHMAILANGPFVQAVLAGGQGDDGNSASRTIASALTTRTAGLVEAAGR